MGTCEHFFAVCLFSCYEIIPSLKFCAYLYLKLESEVSKRQYKSGVVCLPWKRMNEGRAGVFETPLFSKQSEYNPPKNTVG